MSEPVDLMQWVEESTGDGSGGWITKVAVDVGWYVIHKGVPNAQSFWPVTVDGDKDAVFETAKNYVVKHDVKNSKGASARPLKAVQLVLHGDSVINRDKPNWQGGILDTYLLGFDEGYREVFSPSLNPFVQSGDIVYGKEFWGQVSYAKHPNPERATYVAADGTVRDNLVPVITNVFANEKEARQVAAENGANVLTTIPDEPDGWNTDFGTWSTFAENIVSSLREDPNKDTSTLAAIGVNDDTIAQLKTLAKDEDIPF